MEREGGEAEGTERQVPWPEGPEELKECGQREVNLPGSGRPCRGSEESGQWKTSEGFKWEGPGSQRSSFRKLLLPAVCTNGGAVGRGGGRREGKGFPETVGAGALSSV